MIQNLGNRRSVQKCAQNAGSNVLNKEYAVSVFFDLVKAYDTTWKYGILKNLHNIELKGHLPNFIKKLFRQHKFFNTTGI